MFLNSVDCFENINEDNIVYWYLQNQELSEPLFYFQNPILI